MLLSGAPTEAPAGIEFPVISRMRRLNSVNVERRVLPRRDDELRWNELRQRACKRRRAQPASFADPGYGFCHTFKFLNKTGVVTVGEICWRRRDSGLVSTRHREPAAKLRRRCRRSSSALTIPEPRAFGCAAVNGPSNPLLIYHRADWRLGYTAGVDYQYRGAAIIYLRNNDMFIENTLQTACSTPAVTPPCVGERFPENESLDPAERPWWPQRKPREHADGNIPTA